MNINLLVSVLISHILCFCFKNPTYLSHSYLLMEPSHKNLHNFESEALPPIKNQEISIYQSPFTVSDSTSPMLAVAILSVMGTAFLLLSYYIFINKWCSNWHQFSLLRRLSSFHTQRHEDPFIALSPTMWNRGLEESMIREIPAFQFEREGEGGSTYCRCVVCLSQFRETEMLRVLPNCSHTFHLDCIDIWLQSNSNCPLCRTSISGTTKYPIDHIVAPSSSPQNSQLLSNSLLGSDEDFVVIELGGEDEIISSAGQQESDVSREVLVHPINHSPKKFENKVGISKTRKCHHVSIMGDEGIHVREKDDQFFIQPIRRSFSMDSAADQQLYLTVQTIIHQGRQFNESSSSGEDDSIIRRSFFPFRQGRGSKNAILPLQSDI